MTRLISRIALVSVVMLALTAGSAMAAQITGSLGFAGGAELSTQYAPNTAITNFYIADILTFNSGTLTTAGGDFKDVPTGSLITFLPTIQFRDNGMACSNIIDGYLGQFSDGTNIFEITLTSLDPDSFGVTTSSNRDWLLLGGTADVTRNGEDLTVGYWSYSMSQPIANTHPEITWAITFASDAAPVPEPATLVLLGTGLFGAAILARRNKK